METQLSLLLPPKLLEDESETEEDIPNIKKKLKLTIYREKMPKDHPYIGDSLYSLGLLNQYDGNFDMATLRFQEALNIYKEKLPKSHSYIIDTLIMMGNNHVEQRDYNKAKQLFQEVLAIYHEKYSKTSPYILNEIQGLDFNYTQIINKMLIHRSKLYPNAPIEGLNALYYMYLINSRKMISEIYSSLI